MPSNLSSSEQLLPNTIWMHPHIWPLSVTYLLFFKWIWKGFSKYSLQNAQFYNSLIWKMYNVHESQFAAKFWEIYGGCEIGIDPTLQMSTCAKICPTSIYKMVLVIFRELMKSTNVDPGVMWLLWIYGHTGTIRYNHPPGFQINVMSPSRRVFI